MNEDRLETIAKIRTAIAEWMTISAYIWKENGVISLRGSLLAPPEKAYKPIRYAVETLGFTPSLHNNSTQPTMYELDLTPGVVTRVGSNATLNYLLFAATVVSVMVVGGLTQDADNNVSFNFGNAFMYAGSLLSILLAHEMGHYLVGRWRGVQTSLPYFIPMPFVLSGTMGAVIVQREPFEDRRTLLEVGLAGPLAGFVLAVPLLIIGLALSEVKDIPADTSSIIIFGDSILTKVVGQFFHGPINPASGRDIFLHPIGLGAWFGLLITGINLIPAGQLDGGHIAYALLGNKAKWVSYAMIAALGVLYFLGSEGWLLWVFLLFVFGRNHPPVLNQASRITPAHLMLALIGVVVFVLTFVPYPVYGL